MRTIDQIIAERGHTTGFDYLRLGLALSVIASHAMGLSHAGFSLIAFLNANHTLPALLCILPSFFALSGFLVAGSLERNTLRAFLMLRVMRIVPALAVEVVLSALIIGPLVTTFSISSYFSNPMFFRYFLNIVGDIHFTLPGVFGNLPLPNFVNAQLWTIPYELKCYVLIAVAALIGLAERPRLFLAATTVAAIALSARVMIVHSLPDDLGLMFLPPGMLSVLSFLFGAGLYFARRAIPYNVYAAAAAALLMWVLLLHSETLYLASLPIAYLTVFLGLQDPRRLWLIRGADYSYGIYLYGFPLQQMVTYLLPDYRYGIVNFVLSVPLACLCAYASWNVVEKGILSRKKRAVEFVNSLHFGRLGLFNVLG